MPKSPPGAPVAMGPAGHLSLPRERTGPIPTSGLLGHEPPQSTKSYARPLHAICNMPIAKWGLQPF